jgi:hypothetical protein
MEQFAYLDMGTGSMLLQALIGGALAGLFILRNAITRLILRIRSFKNRKKQPSDDTPNEKEQ